MKKTIQISALISCIIISSSCSQEYTCKIKGTVIGRNSKEILIAPITADRNNITYLHEGIMIPVIDNKFEYDLKTSYVEAYNLYIDEEIENGGLVRMFFPDSSVVEITLYPDDQKQKNTVKGGKLNRINSEVTNLLDSFQFNPQYNFYSSLSDSLFKADKIYTEKYRLLNDRIRVVQNLDERYKLEKERSLLIDRNEKWSPETLEISNKLDSINQISKLKKFNYIKTYINTNQNIYSYFLLYKMAAGKQPDVEYIASVFPLFSKEFPTHPYTKKIEEILYTINNIHVGGQYIDFSAPTIDGKMVKLSDEIKGKVTLIDLWATWCAPCRVLNKSIIPVYEKFKDKGFTVIGVVGLYKNTNDYKIVMEKEKYPWLNLIELNNNTGIWSKYGIANSGGATFLVDQTGKILALTPSADELDKQLSELLK